MAHSPSNTTYLCLRNDVDVQVGGLLITKLAAELLHLTKGRLCTGKRHRLFARVKINTDLMDVLPRFAARCRLLRLLKSVDNSNRWWAEVKAELQGCGQDETALCIRHLVAAGERGRRSTIVISVLESCGQ